MRDPEELESDRLRIFLAHGRPSLVVGPIEVGAAALGTTDDWAAGTQGGTLGGSVTVSAAAIGRVLGYVEQLAGDAGIIPPVEGRA